MKKIVDEIVDVFKQTDWQYTLLTTLTVATILNTLILGLLTTIVFIKFGAATEDIVYLQNQFFMVALVVAVAYCCYDVRYKLWKKEKG